MRLTIKIPTGHWLSPRVAHGFYAVGSEADSVLKHVVTEGPDELSSWYVFTSDRPFGIVTDYGQEGWRKDGSRFYPAHLVTSTGRGEAYMPFPQITSYQNRDGNDWCRLADVARMSEMRPERLVGYFYHFSDDMLRGMHVMVTDQERRILKSRFSDSVWPSAGMVHEGSYNVTVETLADFVTWLKRPSFGVWVRRGWAVAVIRMVGLGHTPVMHKSVQHELSMLVQA